ncbi:Hypothetical protein CINCED_3A008422, partial [Cinara cedri]
MSDSLFVLLIAMHGLLGVSMPDKQISFEVDESIREARVLMLEPREPGQSKAVFERSTAP